MDTPTSTRPETFVDWQLDTRDSRTVLLRREVEVRGLLDIAYVNDVEPEVYAIDTRAKVLVDRRTWPELGTQVEHTIWIAPARAGGDEVWLPVHRRGGRGKLEHLVQLVGTRDDAEAAARERAREPWPVPARMSPAMLAKIVAGVVLSLAADLASGAIRRRELRPEAARRLRAGIQAARGSEVRRVSPVLVAVAVEVASSMAGAKSPKR